MYLYLEILCIGYQSLFPAVNWTSEELNLDSILWYFPAVFNFTCQQSIPSGNELKITASPTYHSLREQIGDTVIFFKDLGSQES